MRRLNALLCAGALLLLASGCQETQAVSSERTEIVATVFPQYDMARAIGGEYADVTLLLSAGQEMHNYEPTPTDVAKISRCDLFLRIGGESEVWTDTLIHSLDIPEERVITLMDAIPDPLEEEEHHHHHHHEHGEEGHDHEEEAHPAYDEHIWNSPVNAIAMAEEVCAALCEADPAHTEIFRQRTADYTAKLAQLDADYRALSEQCGEGVLVIGDKFPFRYLAAEYGFHYAAAFTGCSSETEPTIGSLSELLEEAELHSADTVFYLEFSSSKICDRICDITGATAAMLHPCHNISKEDMENGVTLHDLLRENYETIKEALL